MRLECWRDAQIVIGNGTYLNHRAELVATGSVRIGKDVPARGVVVGQAAHSLRKLEPALLGVS